MLITMKRNNHGHFAMNYPIEHFSFLFLIAIATATSFLFSGTPSLGDMAFLKNRF